jgi:PBP1b-binding outer membrane lipoprotein LpoB
MRALLLIAGAALVLAACKNNDQTDKTQNFDENLTAENIVSNDVTAIDAVTGDAANMAADVDYSNLADNSLDNMLNDSGNAAMPAAKTPRATPRPAEPAANTTTNAE